MLIFITGYMASGKTTTGKTLAGRLNYAFRDLDDLIEIHTGKSIVQTFDESGEEGFRKIEREVLMNHLHDSDTVIATGGGTPCYEDNMELMNRAGLTVFLDTPVDIIVERLLSTAGNRPMLKNVEPGNLPGFIRDHLERRSIYYEKAAIRIEAEGLDLIFDAYSF